MGFVIGLFLGATLGIFILGLMKAAGRGYR